MNFKLLAKIYFLFMPLYSRVDNLGAESLKAQSTQFVACSCVYTVSAWHSGYTAESHFLTCPSSTFSYSGVTKIKNKVQLWLLCLIILAQVLADKGRDMRKRCHNTLIVPISEKSMSSPRRARSDSEAKLGLVDPLAPLVTGPVGTPGYFVLKTKCTHCMCSESDS